MVARIISHGVLGIFTTSEYSTERGKNHSVEQVLEGKRTVRTVIGLLEITHLASKDNYYLLFFDHEKVVEHELERCGGDILGVLQLFA